MGLVHVGREVARLRLAVILCAVVLAGCTGSRIGSSPPPSASPPPSTSAPTAAPVWPGERTPYPTGDIVKVILHSHEPAIQPEDEARAIALALADPRVMARLAGARYRALYVTAPPQPSEYSKEPDPQTLPEVRVYDYTADRWLDIPVDLATGSVGAFKESDPGSYGFPQISVEEAEAAVSLAVADPAVSELMVRGYELIVQPVRVGGIGGVSCVTRRCVVVILHNDAINRSAIVQVDLGAELVVGVSTNEAPSPSH